MGRPAATTPEFRSTRLLQMDELQARPCEVDGVPALFHRWIEEESVLVKVGIFVPEDQRRAMCRSFYEDQIIPDGCTVTTLHHTFALVELRDGTVHKVKPEMIRFVKEG
jgi:hypothetical protein